MSLPRKRRFARNLDKLLRARNLTRKEAAEGALVPYQWLRRAVVDGISRIEARNSGHLSSLAEYLGLPSPDRFWDGGLYVEPARDLTEYEAGRIGEMMREYVTLVGPDDGLVRLIAGQLGPAVHRERERKRRLDAVRKAAEEAEAARASGSRLDDSLRRWQAYREALTSVLAHGKSEKELGEREFKATAEDAERARRAIELFRTQFVDGWRAIGLPHAEEIRLDPWLVAVHAASTDAPSPKDFASIVKAMWMEDYAGLLDRTVEEAEDFIRSYVRGAYRLAEDLVARRRLAGSPLRGWIDRAVERRAPPQELASPASAPPVEIPAIVHEALGRIRRSVETRFRDAGLPRIGEVTVTPEEVAAHPELLAEVEARKLCGGIMHLVWIPKYAAILGVAPDEASVFVWERLEEARFAAEAGGHGVEGVPGPTPVVETPEHLHYEGRRRVAAQEAVSLIPRVYAALAPEQVSRMIEIHGCDEEAELWVRSELYEELAVLQFEAAPSSAAILEQAVDAVVERAVEGVAAHDGGHAGDGSARSPASTGGEQIAADERPLEARQRVEHLDDEDLGYPSGPIGVALEDEITSCVADDLSKYDEQADDVLDLLADAPMSSEPRETYRAALRRLGDPRSLAKAALRHVGGDLSKALHRLVRQVDGCVEDEKARASAVRRSRAAAPGDRTNPPLRNKKPDVVPPKLIRKAVLGLHRRGADQEEILEALTNDPYLPDHVRRAPQGRLERAIQQILARLSLDDDDWTRDYQDFSSDDEEDYR